MAEEQESTKADQAAQSAQNEDEMIRHSPQPEGQQQAPPAQGQGGVPAQPPGQPNPEDVVAPAGQHSQPPVQPEETRQPQPPKVQFQEFQATVTKMETHHSGLWEFDFRLDKPIDFKAGQYVSVFMEGMKPAPFSIASSPAERNSLVLGVEIVGQVTGKMAQLNPGDTVMLKGPFGHFTIDPHEHKVCFLAGGIGVTPFMSMLRWIRDESPDVRGVMFYSCRTMDQFMWLDEMIEMHNSNANIQVIPTLTRDQPAGWEHETGRISEEMIEKHLPDYDEYIFFSCGPQGLIDAMFSLLQGMGVPKENLRREAWH